MTDSQNAGLSLVGFVVALVTVSVGAAAGLVFVPLVGSYLGMLFGGFAAGVAVEDRPLAEAAVAALLVGLAILVAGASLGGGVGAAVSALATLPAGTLLTTTVLSFAVGAFGAHFGDDLRDGLTASVEPGPSGLARPETAPVLSTGEAVSTDSAVGDSPDVVEQEKETEHGDREERGEPERDRGT